MENFSSFKLIIFLAMAVGAFLLYLLYLIIFTPNGIIGNLGLLNTV